MPKPGPRSRLRRGLLIAALVWVWVAAAGLTWLGLLAAAAPASASNLLYYGGPVMHSTNVVLVQWGPHVRGTYTDPSMGDPGLFRYLVSQDGATSDIGGVLAQYMDTTGTNSQNHFSFSGSVQINPAVASNPPASVQDSAIQTELARDIGAGTLPAPSGDGLSTVYVVLFPPRDDLCMGGSCAYDSSDGFCAYHGSFQLSGSPTQVLYAAIPDNGPGTPNDGYCGPSVSDLANQTGVVSHEMSETINDPLVDESPGSGPPVAWYDPTYDGEIADKCDAQPLAANGPWSIEPLWSNLDHNCEPGEPAFSAPTASFLAPNTATAGQLVSFNGSSSRDPAQNHVSALEQGVRHPFSISSGIAGYRWNWGDHSPNTTSSTPMATHAFPLAGTYQVSLTVTDSLGFTSTITRSVAVTAASAAPIPTTGGVTRVDDQGATLNGTIDPQNHAVSYRFRYGASPGALTQATQSTPGPPGQHPAPVSTTISGLEPSTAYYYELELSAGGQTFDGSIQSFITGAGAPGAQTPVVGTGAAARIADSGAVLTGTINPGDAPDASYDFSYGATPSQLDQTTASTPIPPGSSAVPVSRSLTGLAQSTTYYFRLDVSVGGQTYSGAVQNFTTLAPPPTVDTGPAARISGQGAVVSGDVNPDSAPTSYLVEFGPDTSYGYSTRPTPAGSGKSSLRVSASLSGLRPHTTYHYRLVATSAGGTAVGADNTFTTQGGPTAAPGFRFRALSKLSERRLLGRRLRVRFRCSRACTARFVLTAAPRGLVRAAAVPLVIARATARLRSGGWGRAILYFVHHGRRHARRMRRIRIRLLLTGYAVARGSRVSSPQVDRIRLS